MTGRVRALIGLGVFAVAGGALAAVMLTGSDSGSAVTAPTPAVRVAALAPCPQPDPGTGAEGKDAAGGTADEGVGRRLPDLTLPCLGERGAVRVGLRALDGRPTVLNLWASWCGPCIEELPAFAKVAERTGERVRFLGVQTQDDARGAAEVVRATGATYPSLFDYDGALLARLPSVVPGLPVTVFVDAEGTVVEIYQGPVLTGDALRDRLADLFGVRV